MGVDQGAELLVGVDAEDSTQCGGRSLFQRLADGDLGKPMDTDPISAILVRFSVDHAADLEAFLWGSSYGDDPVHVIVGTRLLEVDFRGRAFLAGPLQESIVSDALAHCQEAFRRIGIPAEPRLWLTAYLS